MMHMKNNTAIILLNYNGWRDTILCIESLQALGDQPYSVFIVDNASTDGSHAELLAYIKHNYSRLGYAEFVTDKEWENQVEISNTQPDRSIHLIQSGTNGGFAFGNNVGIKRAIECNTFNYFWLLNSDTIVESNALRPMINEFNRDEKIGMVGSVLIYMDTKQIIQAVGGVEFYNHLARGDQIGNGANIAQAKDFSKNAESLSYIAGASLLISSDFIKDVGLMTEHYFLYFEELDWSLRAKKKGYRLSVALDSVVFHKEGASIGTSSKNTRSLLSEYYLSRNLIMCYRHLLPIFLPFALFRNIVNGIKLIKKGDFNRIKIIMMATIDGLFGRGGKAKSIN